MKAKSTQSKILREGRKLLHTRGYSATGVSAVVDAAHVPKGSFYNHFASKDDFALAALESYFKDVLDTLVRSATGETPIERARNYFEALLAVNARASFAEGCLIGNLSGEVGALSDPLRERLAQMLEQWSSDLADKLFRCETDADDRAALTAKAALLLDAWQGAVLRSKAERSDVSLRRFVTVLLPAVLDEHDHQ